MDAYKCGSQALKSFIKKNNLTSEAADAVFDELSDVLHEQQEISETLSARIICASYVCSYLIAVNDVDVEEEYAALLSQIQPSKELDKTAQLEEMARTSTPQSSLPHTNGDLPEKRAEKMALSEL